MISAADLKTTGEHPEGHYFHGTGYITGEGYNNAMVAPVYLPDGAVVKDTYAIIIDNDNSYYLFMNLAIIR